MSELRDYQQDLLERVHRALLDAPDARVMFQLPTGGGKTRIAGELLSRWLKDWRKAVWLTHRKELAAQTEGMLQQDGVTATSNMRWESHTNAPTLVNGVVILMAQTVSRRTAAAEVWNGYDGRDLMIIDEAHHATADGWARAMRQWPGPVLGMTATPWRLSQREGFDHLFEELVCGPQVAALQSDGWLCNARALSPPEDEMIHGGQIDSTGEYSEPGIERANENRDVWTAGALRFWQKHGEGRQTVVYAVSVEHARNLANVFHNAGIPSGVLVADTPDTERAELIQRFRNGRLKALVNVAVATEGFDLPDAACVLMTRPTMSLALYLQMVGRGLRPKPNSGDCVVLDMAGNSLRHGLPEEDRGWFLRARGEQPPGDAPLIRCERCDALSPASSHYCNNCGWAFGEDCGRCGAWRAWKRWDKKGMCGQDHEPVCDLCHRDAHIRANLPVTEELKELAVLQEDDELSPYRNPYLKDLLEEERRRISGASDERMDDLRRSVEQLESDLKDDERVYHRFEQYRDSLPHDQRPFSRRQNASLYVEWESKLETELEGWKGELARLEAQSVDGQLVLRNVRERLLRMLEAEAREAGLIQRIPVQMGAPQQRSAGNATEDSGEWLNLIQISEWAKTRYNPAIRPWRLQDPQSNEMLVSNWLGLLAETAEWLIREGLLTEEKCPVPVGGMSDNYLIHVEPVQPSQHSFRNAKRLSNGLWLNGNHGGGHRVAALCAPLMERLGRDPAQFHVQLSQASEAGAIQRVRDRISALQPPSADGPVTGSPGPGQWMTFTQLAEQGTVLLHRETSTWPQRLRDPRGNEVYVNRWIGFLREVAEWFIREGLLTKEKCPVVVWGMHERCLINSEPVHTGGKPFRRVIRLSNELYLEGNLYSRDIARHCAPMVQKLGKDPAQFHVQLSN